MKKKIVYLLLVFCICFQMVSSNNQVYGNSLFDQYKMSTLALDMNEDFSQREENEPLRNCGWNDTTKKADTKVVLDPEDKNNKCGYIFSKEGSTIVDNIFAPVSGKKIAVAYRIKVNSLGSRQVVSIYGSKKDTGERGDVLTVGYDDSGRLLINGSTIDERHYVNKWQEYNLLIDLEKNCFDVYKDGKAIAESKELKNNVKDITTLRFFIKHPDNCIYFDDVKIGIVPETKITANTAPISTTPAAKTEKVNNSNENYAWPPEMAAWTEADKEAQRQAAVTMLANIKAAAAKGEKTITVPPGYYRVGNKEIQTFGLYNMKDVTILGYGAEIIREGLDDAVEMFYCKNVAFKGFTIDFDPLPFTQLEITRIDKENKYFEVRQENGFTSLDTFINAWNSGARCSIYQADRTRQVPSANREVVLKAEPIGPGMFRAYFRGNYYFDYDYGIQPGDILVVSKRNNGRAMTISFTEKMLFEDINIYASSAFTIAEVHGEGGNVYRRVRLIRRPNTKRLFVGAADGFNSEGMEKGSILEECEISNIADDYVNLRGSWSIVYNQLSPTKVIFGKAGVNVIDVGSEVGFYNVDNLKLLGSAKVIGIEPIYNEILTQNIQKLPQIAQSQSSRAGFIRQDSMRGYILELDKPVDVKVGDIINTDSHSGRGAIIRNCYFHDGLVRGILAHSSDMVIENNRFERTGGPAVLVLTEVYYLEGPFSHDMTIRNNIITESNIHQRGRYDNPGAITIYNTPYINGSGLYRSMQGYNINVLNNTIKNCPVGGIFGANLKDSRVEGNIIDNVYMWKPDLRIGNEIGVSEPFYGIYFTAAENIDIKNNTFLNLSEYNYGKVGTGKYVKNIHIEQ